MSALVLLHGFGSSFDHNWQQTGWVDILADFGVTVPPIDLPAHGSSPPFTDPADYGDADEAVRNALPADGPVAGVGFSAGAELLLRLAVAEPERFDRIVLLGLGDNAFESGDPAALVSALESSDEPEDVRARTFRRLARSAGNDPEDLLRISCPVLVVLGDRDWVGPADRLMAALPSASLVSLSGVDHFATPSDFGAIDATVKFLGLE
jgi:pimeloyl-ACP methyl ester carboxylesterase